MRRRGQGHRQREQDLRIVGCGTGGGGGGVVAMKIGLISDYGGTPVVAVDCSCCCFKTLCRMGKVRGI